MRFFLSFFLTLVASVSHVAATPQESDTFIYKGASCPVLGFRFGPDLSKKLYTLVTEDDRWLSQSSLWRGYRAVLQLRDDKLFLTGVDLNCHEPKPSIKEILGFEIPDQGVHADFFTGELVYGFGDAWGYLHNSSAGDQPKKLRKYVFEKGVLKGIEDVETEKPVQLIQDRILQDIEMLRKVLDETEPDDSLRAAEPGKDGEGR